MKYDRELNIIREHAQSLEEAIESVIDAINGTDDDDLASLKLLFSTLDGLRLHKLL